MPLLSLRLSSVSVCPASLSLSLTLVSRVSVLSFLCLSPHLSFHLCSVTPAPQTPDFSPPSIGTQVEFPVASLDRWFPVSACPCPLLPAASLCISAERTPLAASHLLLLPSVALKCVHRRAGEKIHFCAVWSRLPVQWAALGLWSGPFVPLRVSLALAQPWAFLPASHILLPPSHAPPRCLGSEDQYPCGWEMWADGPGYGQGVLRADRLCSQSCVSRSKRPFPLGFGQYCPALFPG